jgi:hypothetical protein
VHLLLWCPSHSGLAHTVTFATLSLHLPLTILFHPCLFPAVLIAPSPFTVLGVFRILVHWTQWVGPVQALPPSQWPPFQGLSFCFVSSFNPTNDSLFLRWSLSHVHYNLATAEISCINALPFSHKCPYDRLLPCHHDPSTLTPWLSIFRSLSCLPFYMAETPWLTIAAYSLAFFFPPLVPPRTLDISSVKCYLTSVISFLIPELFTGFFHIKQEDF